MTAQDSQNMHLTLDCSARPGFGSSLLGTTPDAAMSRHLHAATDLARDTRVLRCETDKIQAFVVGATSAEHPDPMSRFAATLYNVFAKGDQNVETYLFEPCVIAYTLLNIAAEREAHL